MPKNISIPNDSDDNVNRLKKTISNMEAAEAAMEFAEGNRTCYDQGEKRTTQRKH